MAKPVFILSLPRSGSTLFQRLLLGSGRCSTLGEPSLLLRFLGQDDVMTRKSVYWEFLVDAAQKDMREKWSGFDQAYVAGVRDLMSRIYDGLADGKEWFVDKTPRYTLIAEEIFSVFPDAKYIVLWRHPLAVASSMAEGKGFWYPEEFSIDLYEGLTRLQSFAEHHADQICQVRYEDIVSNPEAELTRIGDYLGWENLPAVLDRPLIESAGGSSGDSTGVKKYKQVSTESLQEWESRYSNWYRRRWAGKYISGERKAIMERHGYEFPESLQTGPAGFLQGLRDSILASKRTARHHWRPAWLKRFARKYRHEHGYDVSFR